MRPFFWLTLAAAVPSLLTAACDKLAEKDKEGEAAPQQAPDPAAGDRKAPTAVGIVHAIADLGPIALVVDGETPFQIAKIVPFDGRPLEVTIASGVRTIEVRDADRKGDPEATVLRDTVQLEAGEDVLLVIAGLLEPLAKGDRPLSMRLVKTRGKKTPDATASTARVIHAASNLPPMDVVLRGALGAPDRPALFVNVGFEKGTSYQQIPAGRRVVVFRNGLKPESPPLFTSGTITFASEGAYTLLLTGEAGSALRPLKLWQLTNLEAPRGRPQPEPKTDIPAPETAQR